MVLELRMAIGLLGVYLVTPVITFLHLMGGRRESSCVALLQMRQGRGSGSSAGSWIYTGQEDDINSILQ